MAYDIWLLSNWELVYYYFTRRKNNCIFEQVHELLRDKIRKKDGKHESPSLALIDSKSVKTTRLSGENRGFDGGNMIKVRKSHKITDTMGLLLAVIVHVANVQTS